MEARPTFLQRSSNSLQLINWSCSSPRSLLRSVSLTTWQYLSYKNELLHELFTDISSTSPSVVFLGTRDEKEEEKKSWNSRRHLQWLSKTFRCWLSSAEMNNHRSTIFFRLSTAAAYVTWDVMKMREEITWKYKNPHDWVIFQNRKNSFLAASLLNAWSSGAHPKLLAAIKTHPPLTRSLRHVQRISLQQNEWAESSETKGKKMIEY